MFCMYSFAFKCILFALCAYFSFCVLLSAFQSLDNRFHTNFNCFEWDLEDLSDSYTG